MNRHNLRLCWPSAKAEGQPSVPGWVGEPCRRQRPLRLACPAVSALADVTAGLRLPVVARASCLVWTGVWALARLTVDDGGGLFWRDAHAASAAAAGSVRAMALICAAASAATRVAWSQTAFRSSAVSLPGPGVARCGVHRCWSLGHVKSAASFPPPYQMGPPSFVVSPGSATEYPVT
jgi:hypothetical protein